MSGVLYEKQGGQWGWGCPVKILWSCGQRDGGRVDVCCVCVCVCVCKLAIFSQNKYLWTP